MSSQDKQWRAPGLRGGELVPCIWMKAGLVAYKLCERDLDCEDCRFDAAMSGAFREANDAEAASGRPADRRPEAGLPAADRGPGHPPRRPSTPPGGWEFRPDRRYHGGHTWARKEKPGHVLCGLDGFAASLLTELTGVILPTVGSPLRQGRIGWWIAAGPQVVPLRAPVSGRVRRRNPRVRAEPGLAIASPYDDGWLLEVECEGDPEAARGLLSAAEIREQAERQMREVHERIAGELSRQAPDLGRTLPDGGEGVTNLCGLVGRERYLALVRSVLG